MSDQELQQLENAKRIADDLAPQATELEGRQGGAQEAGRQAGQAGGRNQHGRGGLFRRMASAITQASPSVGQPAVQALHAQGAAHPVNVVLPAAFDSKNPSIFANMLGNALAPAELSSIAALAVTDPTAAREQLAGKFNDIAQAVGRAGDAVALSILRQAAQDPANATRYYFAAAQRLQQLARKGAGGNADAMPAPVATEGAEPLAAPLVHEPVMAAHVATITKPTTNHAPAVHVHDSPLAAAPAHTIGDDGDATPIVPVAPTHAGKANSVVLRNPAGAIAEFARTNLDIGANPGDMAPLQMPSGSGAGNDNTVGYAMPGIKASTVAMRKPRARKTARRQPKDFRGGYRNLAQGVGGRSRALAQRGVSTAQAVGQTADQSVSTTLATDAQHAARLSTAATTPTAGVARAKRKPSYVKESHSPVKLDATTVAGDIAGLSQHAMPAAPLATAIAVGNQLLTNPAPLTAAFNAAFTPDFAGGDLVAPSPMVAVSANPIVAAPPKETLAVNGGANAVQSQFDSDIAPTVGDQPATTDQANVNKGKIRSAAGNAKKKAQHTKAASRANSSQQAAHQQKRNAEGKQRAAAGKQAASTKQKQQELEAANTLKAAKDKLRQEANDHATMALAMLSMTAEQRDKLFQDTLAQAEKAANDRFTQQRDKSVQDLADNKLKLTQANAAALKQIDTDCDAHKTATHNTMKQLASQLKNHPKTAAQTALDLGKKDVATYTKNHSASISAIDDTHTSELKRIAEQEKQIVGFWQGKADASADDPQKQENAKSQIEQAKAKATGDRTRADNRHTTDTQQENAKFEKLSTERKASAQKAHDEILHDSKAYLTKIVDEEKTLIDAIEKERTDGKNTANERMAVDDAALTRMQKDEYATLEVQLKTELDDARLAAASAKKDSAGKSIADKEKAKRDIETARTNALAKIDAANSETLYLAQMEVDYAHSEINNSLKDLGSYTVKAVRDISSLQSKLEREVDDTTGRITARAKSAVDAQDNIVKSVKADLAETKSSYHGGSAAKFHTNIDAEKAAVVNLRERDKEYFAALQAKREGKPPDWDKKKDKARQSIRDAVTISGGDPSKIQAALLDATNGDPKLIAEILGDPTVSKALLQMAATDNAVWRGPFGTFDNWSSALSGKAPSNPTVDAIMAMGQCKDRNEVKAKMLDQAFNGGLTGWGYDADLISKIYDSTPPGERDKLNEKFKAATGKSLEQQHASENQTSSFFASATGNGERSDSQKLLDAQWQGRDQGIAEAKRQAASGGVMGSATKFVQDHPVVAGLAVVASGGVLAGPALALGTGQLDGMGNNVSGYLAQNDKIRDEVEIKPEDSYETRMEKQRRQRELFGNIEKYLETEGTSTEKLDHNIASSQYNKAFGSSQRLDDALTAMRKGDFKGYSTNLGAYQQETAFGDHKKAGDEGKRAQAYGYGKEYRAFQADIYAARHGGGKSSDPEGDYVKYVKENVNAVDANYIINQTQDKADPKTDPDKAAKQIAARLVYAQFGGMTGFGNDTDAMSEEFKNLPKEVKDKIAAEYAKQCLELGLTAGNQTAGNYFWGNTSTGNLESDMNLSYNGVSGVLMQGARKGIAAVTGSDNVGLVSPLLASETAGQSNEYLMATRDLSLGRAETPAEQLARAKYSNDLAKSGMLGSVGFGDAGGETERALAKQQEAYDRLSKLGLADKKIEELDPDSLTPEQASALKAFQDANESAEGWQKVAVTQQKSATEFVIDGVVTVVTVAAAVAAEVFTLGAATPIIITAVAGVMGVMAKSAALGGKFSGVEIDRGLVSAAVQAVSAGLAAGKGLEQLSEQLVKNAGQKIARAIVKEVLEAAINAGANITQTLLDPATYAGSPEEIRARLLGAIKSAAIQTGVSAVARGAIKGKLDLPENMSFGQKMLNDQLGYGGALDTALQYDFTSNNPREEVQKVLSAAIQTGIQTAATHVATGMYAKYQAGKVPGKGGVGSNGEIVVPAAEKTAVVDAIIKEGGTVTEVPRPKDSDSPATVLMVTTKDGHHVPLVVPNEHVVNHEKLPTEKPVDHNTEKVVEPSNDKVVDTSEKKTSNNGPDDLLTITDGRLSNENSGTGLKTAEPHSKLLPSDTTPTLEPAQHTMAQEAGIPADRADLRKMVAEKYHEVLTPFLDSTPTAHPEYKTLIEEFKQFSPGELGKPENKAKAKELLDRWSAVAAEIAQRTGHDETVLREIYNKVEKQDFPVWHQQMAGLTLEAQAKLAHMHREELKLMVRDIMADAHSKEVLFLRDLALYGHRHGPQFEALMQKALAKHPDEKLAYEKIIGSSKESNKDVNKNIVGNETGISNGNADTGKVQNKEAIPPSILAQQNGVGHGQVDLHSHWMGNVSPEAMRLELARSGGSKGSDVSSWEPLLRELNRLSSNAELTHQRNADGKIKSKDVDGEKDGGRGKSGDALEIVAEALRDIDKLKKKLDRDAPPDVQERRRQDIDALAKAAVEAALRSSSETDFNSAYEVRDELVKNFYGKAERASVMGDSQSIVAKKSELLTHFEGRPVIQERIERAAANEPRLEALEKRKNLSEAENAELKKLRGNKALVLEQFAYDRYSIDTIVRLAQDNIKYTEQSNSAKKLVERFDPEQMAFIKEIAKREHPELAANIDALVVKHLAMITSNNFGERDQGVRQDDIPGKNRGMTSDEDFKRAHDQVVALANRSDIAGMDVAGAEHFAFNEQGQQRFAQLFVSLAALAQARKQPVVFRPHVGEGGIDVTTGNNFSTDANRQVKNSGDFTHVERAKENIGQLLSSLENVAKNFGGTLPPDVSVRFGHATHATPEQIARMKALGVIVEVNLTSNQATGSLAGEKPAPGQKDAERPKRTGSTGDDRSGNAMLEQHALGSMVFHDIDVMLSTDGHDVMDTHLAKEYAKAKQVLEDIHDNLLDVRITVEQARAMNQAGGKVVIPVDAQPNDIVSIKYVEMSKAKQELFDRAYLKFFQTASRYTATPSPTP